jgi:hypothetical protein
VLDAGDGGDRVTSSGGAATGDPMTRGVDPGGGPGDDILEGVTATIASTSAVAPAPIGWTAAPGVTGPAATPPTACATAS